jgi:hypothetical protein
MFWFDRLDGSKKRKIIGITPAMPSGSSLKFMMDAFPNVLLMWELQQHAVLWPLVWQRRLLQHLLYFSTKLMTKLFMMWLYKIFQFFVWTELD